MIKNKKKLAISVEGTPLCRRYFRFNFPILISDAPMGIILFHFGDEIENVLKADLKSFLGERGAIFVEEIMEKTTETEIHIFSDYIEIGSGGSPFPAEEENALPILTSIVENAFNNAFSKPIPCVLLGCSN